MPEVAALPVILQTFLGGAGTMLLGSALQKDPKEIPKQKDQFGNTMNGEWYADAAGKSAAAIKRPDDVLTFDSTPKPKDAILASTNPYEQPQQQMIQDPRKPRGISPAAMVASSGIMGRMPS